MEERVHPKDEIDFIDYIKIIYKRRWMILIIVVISICYTVASGLRQPDVYEATVTFFPMNMNYGIPSETVSIKPQIKMEDLIISILESRKMAERIIEQLDLKNRWNIKFVTGACGLLKSSTEISLDRNGLIKLSVKSGSPKLAAEIANAYVDNLGYLNTQLDLGPYREIVQVIDRATVPETKAPRSVAKRTIRAGLSSLVFAIFLALFLEFVQKSIIWKRLKER